MKATQIIAIGGGTGSGKSTLADVLSEKLDAHVIRIDDYYYPLNHLDFHEREQINFDAPDSIDHDLLIQKIETLVKGDSITKPIYDFTQHTRGFGEEIVTPSRYLIVDGLFALHWPGLLDHASLKVFVDTAYEHRFRRRLKRDIEERGRDQDEVTHRFENHVNPMHELYVEPTRQNADLIVSGDGSLEFAIDQVLNALYRSTSPSTTIFVS